MTSPSHAREGGLVIDRQAFARALADRATRHNGSVAASSGTLALDVGQLRLLVANRGLAVWRDGPDAATVGWCGVIGGRLYGGCEVAMSAERMTELFVERAREGALHLSAMCATRTSQALLFNALAAFGDGATYSDVVKHVLGDTRRARELVDIEGRHESDDEDVAVDVVRLDADDSDDAPRRRITRSQQHTEPRALRGSAFDSDDDSDGDDSDDSFSPSDDSSDEDVEPDESSSDDDAAPKRKGEPLYERAKRARQQ